MLLPAGSDRRFHHKVGFFEIILPLRGGHDADDGDLIFL
jgi:hypothetical protein